MADETKEDCRLVQYLLGLLPEEESEHLDERSICDPDFAWQLKAAENDLVDAYVRHELDGETLERFRSYFLSSPQRREKVELAQALITLENRPALIPSPKPWRASHLLVPRWGIAASLFVALCITGYLFYQNLQLQKTLSHVNPPVPRKEAPLRTLAVVLPPPTRAAVSIRKIYVPAGTDRVHFDLLIDTDDFPSYRADLTVPGNSAIVWSGGQRTVTSNSGRRSVSVDVPVNLLTSRTYAIELAGVRAQGSEPIGTYAFSVEMQ